VSADFDGLAAPAKRALANAGIGSLAELAKRSRAEVARLHGMGPNALEKLEAKLAAAGLAFAR
jgi:hypothetical protein